MRDESNFVHFMDVALDLVAPLSLFATQDTSNTAPQHAAVSEHLAYILCSSLL